MLQFFQTIADFLLNIPPYAFIFPNEGGVLLRGGKYKRTLFEGFYWKWPIYDTVQSLDVTTQVINLPNQSITTQDGHCVAVSGAIEYLISDARKALLCIQDFDTSLQNAGMAFVCHYLNRKSLQDCTQIGELEKEVLRGLRSKVENWGLSITKFWITDFAEHKVYRIMSHDTPVVVLEEE